MTVNTDTTVEQSADCDGPSAARVVLELGLPCVLVVAALCTSVWLWRAELRATALANTFVESKTVDGLAQWHPDALAMGSWSRS